jgi:hypothetical protein
MKNLTVPEKHQLKIARDTLRMNDVMARIMGGPNRAEARAIILRLTGKFVKPTLEDMRNEDLMDEAREVLAEMGEAD